MTYEMRDEIGKPRDCDGSKNHTGRPHTQNVRVRLGSPGDIDRCVVRNKCDGCCDRGISVDGGSTTAATDPPVPPRRSEQRPSDHASHHRYADSAGAAPRDGNPTWPQPAGSWCSRVESRSRSDAAT